MSRQHGVSLPSQHPSGNRGNHVLQGFNSVTDEAARAALVQTSLDRGRVIEQTAGTAPGFYVALGTTGSWQALGTAVVPVTVAGITAGATQTQAGATALTADVNQVSTVTTTNDGVKLKAAAASTSQTVINDGANTMKVWPASGDNLGAGVDTAITQAAGTTVTYTAYDATNWRYASMTPADGSITSAKLANMVQGTVKGRAAGAGTGVPTDRTDAQLLLDMTTVTAGITAGTTQTQAGATALTTVINQVGTAAVANDGVKLLTAVAGQRQLVINTTANPIKVWPNTSDNIGAGVDIGVILGAGEARWFTAYDATNWRTEALVFRGITVLTSGTSWAVPLDTWFIKGRMVGAGGGGGGVTSAAAQSAVGSGGGAGAYTEFVLAVVPGASVSYVIGVGGAGGADSGAAGSNGTATTFNAGAITAPGGEGGGFSNTSIAAAAANAGAGGVAGTGGSLMRAGDGGGVSFSTGTIGILAAGGSSRLGSAEKSMALVGAVAIVGASASANSGAGGRPGGNQVTNTPEQGGNGGSGVIILERFG